LIVFKFSQIYVNYRILRIIFSLALAVVELLEILWFSLNKSFNTYLGPMLPPGNRNWWPIYHPNCDESAAPFCRWVAAWLPNIFCNFYSVKTHKIANNLTATRQIKHVCGVLKILEKNGYVCINLKIIKFYLVKLATNFSWQPSYLLSERASLS
jgi:hypothetical protein